ncbi:MAG TPA: acyltransferase family protein [Methanobacterium sp.]|nr:MAG: hypothetical protein FGO69_04970 [Methanobacterium sp.]HOI71022.1 acyltransferase family protein [Methanobacterium sp.]
MSVRKYYLDNLRLMVILFLFPYHTLIIYSGVADYYFNVANNLVANALILSLAPWFMQLLFTIAGIATYYSLKRRNSTQYLKERVSKLLIPTLAGVVLVIPVSIYFGILYQGFDGSFLSVWWTMMSNWMEYLANGLLLGPLWFLLYLFIISIIALPFIMKYKKSNWRIPLEKVTVPKLLLLVIPLALGSYFLNIYPEKSLIQFLLLFIFGYFLLSDDGVQERLEKSRWPLFISFLVLLGIYVYISAISITASAGAAATTSTPLAIDLLVKLLINLIMWLGVLSVMGMGKHYLEFKNKSTMYLAGISFPIYIFHIVWINLLANYIIGWIPDLMVVQVILIMALSFVLTLANIEVVKRIKGLRSLFGLGTKKKQETRME